MASPPDYVYHSEPLMINHENSQMCERLLHWLDENNLGQQDLISVTALKDALAKSNPKTAINASKFSCNKCGVTVLELAQDFKTYLIGVVIMIAFYIIEFASLYADPEVSTTIARSAQIALAVLFLLFATYWWGRRGPPLKYVQGSHYLKIPSSNISRMNMEYYA